MKYMDENYQMRQEDVSKRTMERGKFSGVDNAAYRQSDISINMTELSQDTNGTPTKRF